MYMYIYMYMYMYIYIYIYTNRIFTKRGARRAVHPSRAVSLGRLLPLLLHNQQPSEKLSNFVPWTCRRVEID
jgi:hypothetical protein